MLYYTSDCVCLHTGVRVVQTVRRVRAPSVWRECVPSAVLTARSAPAPPPQPSPAPPPANTQTGTVNATHSNKHMFLLVLHEWLHSYKRHVTNLPCDWLPCRSMSDDEQESGCDTVDSSPTSDASGHSNSPFTQRRIIADSNQNCEPRVACIAPVTEPSKPAVRTVVVPPMRVLQNNNNYYPAVSETYGNTGTTGYMMDP